jgi:hypothetical protein
MKEMRFLSLIARTEKRSGQAARIGGGGGRGKVHTGILWGNLREGDHLKDPGIDGRMIFK